MTYNIAYSISKTYDFYPSRSRSNWSPKWRKLILLCSRLNCIKPPRKEIRYKFNHNTRLAGTWVIQLYWHLQSMHHWNTESKSWLSWLMLSTILRTLGGFLTMCFLRNSSSKAAKVQDSQKNGANLTRWNCIKCSRCWEDIPFLEYQIWISTLIHHNLFCSGIRFRRVREAKTCFKNSMKVLIQKLTSRI